MTVSGNIQPRTAAGQNEVAEAILELAAEAETPQFLVLAGLSADVEDKDIHVICADVGVRRGLEAIDIPVSRNQPEAGMIGVAGLLVSLSPLHNVPAVALVAETVGASADVIAANRLANWIEQAFELPLQLDLDSTEQTARKLLESVEVSGTIADHLGLATESDDFYV